jgi:CxxC motif-containing protein (DUF1111 family)
MSRRTATALFIAVVASLFAAGSASADNPPNFGDPLRGLTAAQLAAFTAGVAEFTAVEAPDEGLGPVFNEASCATCHSVGAVGGGSTRVETRFGRITNGKFDPMAEFGGSLIQDHAIAGFVAETVPVQATIRTGRRTTPLFGLGLVDAVPDNFFQFLASLEAAASPGTAGKVHMVSDPVHGGKSVGKFGWKAQVPNLNTFAGDAYLNEMGITNPLFPDESCPQGDCSLLSANPFPGINDTGSGVLAFTDFMTLLAPPPRGPINGDVVAGELVALRAGCFSCHTPILVTGNTSPVAALRNKLFEPFSDFLLHDMGSLGDGIVQGDATGREIRTSPLWGLRLITTFLHDGRATTIDAAILAHDGQGRAARDRFAALNARDKARLLAFLKSL